MAERKDLAGKIALITGASSGIGAATAKYFAKHGAKLVLTGRNEENLNKVTEECSSSSEAIAVAGDVCDELFCKTLLQKTVERFGQLHILVNCAGIVVAGSVETASMEQYDHVMETNTRSVYHLTQLTVPLLAQTQGNIVNVSSVNGLRAFAGVNAYCMSKAAVDQCTRVSALELAPKKIRVNSVNPGVIITEIHRRGGMDDATYDKFLKRSELTHALQRTGQPDEVASVISFLASDRASNITGASIPIDGGRHLLTNLNNISDF